MRLRIALAALVGVVLIGIFGWPLAAPTEPYGAVSLLAGDIGFGGAAALAGLAVLCGFLGYFLAWPYGSEIGVLAVPSGLAVLAIRTCSMSNTLLLNPSFAGRGRFFAIFKWEAIFWVAIVVLGFSGVLLGKIIAQPKAIKKQREAESKSKVYLNTALAVVGSVLVVQFCIKILAQDFKVFDNQLGLVIAQPANIQIIFAVLISFLIVGFLVKKFLNVSYIWPVISSAFITFYVSSTYVKPNTLGRLIERWPVVFFSHSVLSILPVQMVSFGALGAICGYWLAVRYIYWQEHES